MKWLNSLPEGTKSAVWDILEQLFEKYLPPTLHFISPALHESMDSVTPSSSTTSGADPVIVPQELKLSAKHVVKSTCQILQVETSFFSWHSLSRWLLFLFIFYLYFLEHPSYSIF